MVSAADPIMASEHFTQMRREDHRNSSDGPDIEDKEKMSRRTTQVMDTVEAPISRTPSILQDEEPIADEIDYRFWMNLAS
ncbi:unnamed protein product [Phytomonas sp. EM1]|nr:unnamed protein product [Phytomonas sp. EM1]|eukprot:CCW63746.1 unnamed protein product [Phytomonas sp. isolate EM1]